MKSCHESVGLWHSIYEVPFQVLSNQRVYLGGYYRWSLELYLSR